MSDTALQTPQEIVARCQTLMAHAWMVRAFVRHSDEAEEFPELMQVGRVIFDTSRALETRVDDPPGYFNMLRKKIGKLRAAAAQFREDVKEASTHTNFQQAIISLDACVDDLERMLRAGQALLAELKPPGASSTSSD